MMIWQLLNHSKLHVHHHMMEVQNYRHRKKFVKSVVQLKIGKINTSCEKLVTHPLRNRTWTKATVIESGYIAEGYKDTNAPGNTQSSSATRMKYEIKTHCCVQKEWYCLVSMPYTPVSIKIVNDKSGLVELMRLFIHFKTWWSIPKVTVKLQTINFGPCSRGRQCFNKKHTHKFHSLNLMMLILLLTFVHSKLSVSYNPNETDPDPDLIC